LPLALLLSRGLAGDGGWAGGSVALVVAVAVAVSVSARALQERGRQRHGVKVQVAFPPIASVKAAGWGRAARALATMGSAAT